MMPFIQLKSPQLLEMEIKFTFFIQTEQRIDKNFLIIQIFENQAQKL
ncbi:unnamed protein product [Paramecium octaurelia]|uniref:Uncharacterized protein n=1 Tax=Paramecium octaurelia TaxID=43137 RepID=A0A8S1U0F2_PAROT|nr:unnamed protein product [Paramecium octaurelia]